MFFLKIKDETKMTPTIITGPRNYNSVLGGDRKSGVLECNALAICEDLFKKGLNKKSEKSFVPSENYVLCLAPRGIHVKLRRSCNDQTHRLGVDHICRE